MLGSGFIPFSDLPWGAALLLFSLVGTTIAIRRQQPDDWQGLALLLWVVFGSGFWMGWF